MEDLHNSESNEALGEAARLGDPAQGPLRLALDGGDGLNCIEELVLLLAILNIEVYQQRVRFLCQRKACGWESGCVCVCTFLAGIATCCSPRVCSAHGKCTGLMRRLALWELKRNGLPPWQFETRRSIVPRCRPPLRRSVPPDEQKECGYGRVRVRACSTWPKRVQGSR